MRQILLTTALAIPLSVGGAYAQQAEPKPEVSPDESGEGVQEAESVPSEEVIVREQASTELLLDWITGTTVRSPDDERIGEIDDLILDGETGQLSAAILGVGGFLGIGEKKIAVNWSELQIDYDANEITMNLTREEAKAAPAYIFRAQEPRPMPAGNNAIGNTTDVEGAVTAPPPADSN